MDDQEKDKENTNSNNEENGESQGGSVSNKIKSLQKQYKDLLAELFEKHAKDCIEKALEESPGGIGENIQCILSKALEGLRSKVEEELDIKNEVAVVQPMNGVGHFGIGSVDLNNAGGAKSVGEAAVEEIEEADITAMLKATPQELVSFLSGLKMKGMKDRMKGILLALHRSKPDLVKKIADIVMKKRGSSAVSAKA